MRTIRITLDTRYCRVSLRHIRCWNVDPEQQDRIVIWVQGFKQPFYATESVESFAERYEKAMDQLEAESAERLFQQQARELFGSVMGPMTGKLEDEK